MTQGPEKFPFGTKESMSNRMPHPREIARLKALESYGILDTPREEAFDSITRIIAYVCDAPIAVINLIDADRQWFKSEIGLGVRETPLDISICAHAILQPGLFIVPDTREDPRFAKNPLVTGEPRLRFYAGALLETKDGLPLGTLCVLDYEPRTLTDVQADTLKALAQQVMTQLELRRTLADQAQLMSQKDALFQELHHRVKNNLAMVSGFLALQGRKAEDAKVRDALAEAQQRIMTVARLHDRLQTTGAVDRVAFGAFLRELVGDLARSFSEPGAVTIEAGPLADVALRTQNAVPAALMINELVTNALRHGRPGARALAVSVSMKTDKAGDIVIEVANNGEPLPEGYCPEQSSGLGMRMILAFVHQLGGKLLAENDETGVCFRIILPGSAGREDKAAEESADQARDGDRSPDAQPARFA